MGFIIWQQLNRGFWVLEYFYLLDAKQMTTFEIGFIVVFVLLSIYTVYDIKKINRKESCEEPIKKVEAEIVLQSDTRIVEPEEDMPYTQKEWTENERLRSVIVNRR